VVPLRGGGEAGVAGRHPRRCPLEVDLLDLARPASREEPAMRVRMKVTISGTRDGQPWPERGQSVDLPDGEAKQMVAAGLAEPHDDSDDGEDGQPPEENTANPGEPEKATGRRKPTTKSAVEK
ncbi:hypothetical protein ACWGOC_33190, partial [Streptomyces sp. NPDC055782]